MMEKEYQEPQKQRARNEALAFAISTLTTHRNKSSIARKSYVRDVKENLQLHGSSFDQELISLLSNDEVKRWEDFYNSIIRRKKPQELRVAYLSGPNPENDIEILVKNGVLPENIWAFESDNKIYSTAVISALNSQFPFVKIYKGKIESYLKILPFKFDIIYLDFCSTILSDKTISVIRDIFFYQKLETLGVLITNFALPNAYDSASQQVRRNLNLMAANYLYPKPFTENYTGLGGGCLESAESNGIDQGKFLKIAKRNEVTFYSQFITRLLFDLPSVIIPYQRLANNESLISLFFKNFNKSSFKEEYLEDLMCFPTEYALIWGLSNYFFIESESFDRQYNKFKRQLSIKNDENTLLEQLQLVSYFMAENRQEGMYSDKLNTIAENWNFMKKHIFCDVFLFHQLKEILVGQLTSPYYYNVEYTRRWMYKAKSTEMFMDLITYDECRYIFDWMPTLDMFEEGVNDWDRQLILRFAMDSVSKQRIWYNNEFFSGTAVVDRLQKNFKAKELKRRKTIR